MVTKILKLKIWKTYKYIEGGRTVPPMNSRKLPPADIEFHDLRVKDPFVIDLPVHRFKVDRAAYLWCKMDIGTAESPEIVEKFGWIEGAETIASSGDACRLRWHEDLWRCAGNVIDAKGWVVKKATGNRPYPFTPSKWIYDNHRSIMGRRLKWVIAVLEQQGKSITAFWDITSNAVIADGKRSPSASSLFDGTFLSKLGIQNASVSGVWICPFQPYTLSNPLSITGSECAAYTKESVRGPLINTESLFIEYHSDDSHITMIIDPYGAIAGVCPWGNDITNIVYHVNIGASSAYIRLYLLKDGEYESTIPYTEICIVEGRAIDIPMVPITYWSNAQSAYVYSGQKEYDRRIAELNAQASLANTGTGIAGGALVGSAASPGIGTAIGAAVGAVADIAGIGINYWKGQEELKAKQELISKQSNNVLGAGQGDGFYAGYYIDTSAIIGKTYRIIQKKLTDYDESRLTADINANGYDTFESLDDTMASFMLSSSTVIMRTVNAEIIIDKGKAYSDHISSKLNDGFKVEERYTSENDVDYQEGV